MSATAARSVRRRSSLFAVVSTRSRRSARCDARRVEAAMTTVTMTRSTSRTHHDNGVTLWRSGDARTQHLRVAQLYVDDLRPPASANLSMNRTLRVWFAPVKDPTSAISTASWLEITSGSGPCSTKREEPATATFVVSMGGMPASPRARGVQRGTRPGGPLWSRRRRSSQLSGLESGPRRRRHDEVKAHVFRNDRPLAR